MGHPSTFQVVWAAILLVWALALVTSGIMLLQVRAKRRGR